MAGHSNASVMPDRTKDHRTKLWFLWHNTLFESTPLTGYAFIHSAKRLPEVILWYAVLILFTGFTANNVRNLINRYNSHPTRTEVLIGSNTTDAYVNNFTLRLKLPMAELYGSTVNWEHKVPFLCHSTHITREFMDAPLLSSHCLLLSLYPLLKIYDPQSRDYTHRLQDFAQFHCKTKLAEFNQSMVTPSVETEQVLKKLDNLYGNNLTALWNNSFVENWQDVPEFIRFHALFNTNYYNPSNEGSGLYLSLYLLLSAISESETVQKYLPFAASINTTKFFETGGITPEEAIDIIRNRLLDIAPVKLPAELNATKMLLRQWTIEFTDKNMTDEGDAFILDSRLQVEIPDIFKQGYNVFGDSFSQEYLVQVPDGVKEFRLDIFPPKQLIEALFFVMHADKYFFEKLPHPMYTPIDRGLVHYKLFKWLIDCNCEKSLADCWTRQGNWTRDEEHEIHQDLTGYTFGKPRTKFLESFFYPLLDIYSRHSELLLDTGSGHIIMEPFWSYDIKYLPTGRITSETDFCTSMQLTECFDLCQSNYTMTNCHCIPWNMQYLLKNFSSRVCHQPCTGMKTNEHKCRKHCESKLAHPCDQFMYRPEIIRQTSNMKRLEEDSVIHFDDFISVHGPEEVQNVYRPALTNNFKLFTFKINIEEVFTYSKTIETYEMSFTTFISEFGGLCDFWLGVDVIGIIHVIMYLFKQLFHCGANHKTGKTIRQLFGQQKVQQEDSSDLQNIAQKAIQKNFVNSEMVDLRILIQKQQNNIELLEKIGEKRHREMMETLSKFDQKFVELERHVFTS